MNPLLVALAVCVGCLVLAGVGFSMEQMRWVRQQCACRHPETAGFEHTHDRCAPRREMLP